MSATVTVTGKAGAGITVTATPFLNVTSFSIDCVNNIITINQGGVVSFVTIDAAATITATKSGSTYTLTIS